MSNQYYREAKRDVDHSYWNALLTLNGILITVFTAFSFLSDFKIITSFIVVLSIWACWLMIKNFKLSQDVFDKLGGTNFPEVPNNPTEEQKGKILNDLNIFQNKYFNLEEAIQLHKEITNNEKIVVWLFYAQMSIIVLLLVINILKDYCTFC